MTGPDGNGPLDEVADIEYWIRRHERALSVIQKNLDNLSAKAETQRPHLKVSRMHHATEISSLKKRLQDLTGRCIPLIPKWPT